MSLGALVPVLGPLFKFNNIFNSKNARLFPVAQLYHSLSHVKQRTNSCCMISSNKSHSLALMSLKKKDCKISQFNAIFLYFRAVGQSSQTI